MASTNDAPALEQIVETADSVPAITIGFDHQPVLAVFAGMAVIFREQVDQQLAVFGIVAVEPDREITSCGLASRLCTSNTQLLRQS